MQACNIQNSEGKSSQLFTLKCPIHLDEKISFVQVVGVSVTNNSNIFLCDQCFDQNTQLFSKNYMMISQIIEKASTNFQIKWPSLTDQNIIVQLQQKSQQLNEANQIIPKINKFFDDFKDEIITKINKIQKCMLRQIESEQFQKEQVIIRYKEISQIMNLRDLLLEGQQDENFQQKCKDFIRQVEAKKESNQLQLQSLLDRCNQEKQIIDFELLNKFKSLCLNIFDKMQFQDSENNVENDQNIISNRNYDEINLLSDLISKQKCLINSCLYQNSNSYLTQNEIVNSKILHNDVDEIQNILQKFPIFDLIKLKQQNILSQLNFQKSEIADGQKRIQINQNQQNQYEIFIDESNYFGINKNELTNCISSMVLKPNKKYIFRLKLESKKNKTYFLFGLMQHFNKNQQIGFKQQLFYGFLLENQKLQFSNWGTEKYLKGEELQMEKDSIIEFRVWLDDKLVQFIDYPNKNYKIELKDKIKETISQFKNDLSLFFCMGNNLDKYILKEAQIVDNFED